MPTLRVALTVNEMEQALVGLPAIAVSIGGFASTLRVASTVIVMEQALLHLSVIAVSTGGVCATTQGSFDCDCYGTGFVAPICDSCKYWRCLCNHSG